MTPQSQPLVSILTPVYNDGEYLAACIESVLSQTYSNWDYTIVDNCSSDESASIARAYAAQDPRIRVVTNEQFLPVVQNHNNALRHVSPGSKYCKFVFADDLLFRACIEEMVKTAESDPSIGLVCAYTLGDDRVLWNGLSFPTQKLSGREVCRRKLLGGPYLFAAATAQLIRADLIRKRPSFYNERNLHADQESCFDILQESDFGFVHQVLSYSRPRHNSTSSFAKNFDSIILGEVVIFLKFGPIYLSDDEYRRRLKYMLRWYHKILAKNVLRFRSKDFWEYHRQTLATCDARIRPWLLGTAVFTEVLRSLIRPLRTIKDSLRWWSEAFSRLVGDSQAKVRR